MKRKKQYRSGRGSSLEDIRAALATPPKIYAPFASPSSGKLCSRKPKKKKKITLHFIPTPALTAWLRSERTPEAAAMADVLERINAGGGTTEDAVMVRSWLQHGFDKARLIRGRDKVRGEALLLELRELEKACREQGIAEGMMCVKF